MASIHRAPLRNAEFKPSRSPFVALFGNARQGLRQKCVDRPTCPVERSASRAERCRTAQQNGCGPRTLSAGVATPCTGAVWTCAVPARRHQSRLRGRVGDGARGAVLQRHSRTHMISCATDTRSEGLSACVGGCQCGSRRRPRRVPTEILGRGGCRSHRRRGALAWLALRHSPHR
jgi:hypothetical protein